MPSGGKRKGAGRKPLPKTERRVSHTINLQPEAWCKIQARAAKLQVSASELINAWAKRLKS